MRDFCLERLRDLLGSLQTLGYTFLPFAHYWEDRPKIDGQQQVILFRHDVDRFPQTALTVARMEAKLGIQGSFFFRVKPGVFCADVVKDIAALGHEIGYHYECLADADGDHEQARLIVVQDLMLLRRIAPVVSVSMHSRPFSPWDSREFFKKRGLQEFGLKGEAYLDIDHHRYLYLADSGRDWRPQRTVVWDKVEGAVPVLKERGTASLIDFFEAQSPDQVQLLVHPNRWPATVHGWCAQAVADRGINILKHLINFVRPKGRQ